MRTSRVGRDGHTACSAELHAGRQPDCPRSARIGNSKAAFAQVAHRGRTGAGAINRLRSTLAQFAQRRVLPMSDAPPWSAVMVVAKRVLALAAELGLIANWRDIV